MTASIRFTLLKRLMLPLVGINLVGAALAYWLAWAPAQAAFDQSLANSAWALTPRLQERAGGVSLDLPKPAEQILRVDQYDAIYFVVRDAQGRTIAGDPDFPVLPLPAEADKHAAYERIMRGKLVSIVALRTLVAGQDVLIATAETQRKRSRTKLQILVSLCAMEAIVTLLVVLTVWFGIGKGLSPLRRVQRELNARRPDDLFPVADNGLPAELAPVVGSINGLLQRVQFGAQAKQKFLADVAHQLRTPLAGLRAQLEWLQQRFLSDGEANRSTKLMMSAIDRMTRQSNQLLSLAHADPNQFERKKLGPVRLDKLIEESIWQFIRQADTKAIDLGFHLDPTEVMGDSFLLRDLIDNLIDNALRYSSAASRVTVSCRQEQGCGMILVEDEGPGIPESAREMVFSRFYRLDDKLPGSGLGLAIVRDIAEDHNATIEIGRGRDDMGTVFSVRIPGSA